MNDTNREAAIEAAYKAFLLSCKDHGLCGCDVCTGCPSFQSYRAGYTAASAEREWQPIDTVPQTGEHVLVANFDQHGFGMCGGKRQHSMDVAHWFEDGLYSSNYGKDQKEPMNKYFTHWMPLPQPYTPKGETK